MIKSSRVSPDFSGEEPGYRDRSRDEKGGHIYIVSGGGWARVAHSCLFVYSYIEHSGLGASTPSKMLKFRPYESASEAVGHNHTKFMATGV